MPVTSTEILSGPNIQADGQYRGVIRFHFHTGEMVDRNVRAPDAVTWAGLPAALTPEVEENMAQQEIESHWGEMELGGNPYYEFIDPLWQRKVFNHVTFETSFSINIKRALGPEFNFSKSAGARIIKPTWDAGTSMGDDLRGMLGMSNPQKNNINSDVANIDSIDTIEGGMNGQHFDDNGSPIL